MYDAVGGRGPGKYNWQIGPQFGWDQDWGWQNWMKVCEGTRGPSGGRSWEKFNGGEEYEGVEHIDSGAPTSTREGLCVLWQLQDVRSGVRHAAVGVGVWIDAYVT